MKEQQFIFDLQMDNGEVMEVEATIHYYKGRGRPYFEAGHGNFVDDDYSDFELVRSSVKLTPSEEARLEEAFWADLLATK